MKTTTVKSQQSSNREFNAALNKRLSKDDQFNSFVIDITVNAGEEFKLPNRLKKNGSAIIPGEWEVVDAAGARIGDLTRGDTKWTTSNLYLKNMGSSNGKFRVRFYEKPGATILTAPDDVVQSLVVVQEGNGYGSTNTKLRRFSTIVTNTGTAITYADSSTEGASFTINTTGIYSIHYSDSYSAFAEFVGISVNPTSGTTNVSGTTYANGRRAINTTTANRPGSVTWVGKLTSGDVVRAHSDGGMNTTGAGCFFTIEKIG